MLEFTEQVAPEVSVLAAPDRVIIDFPEVSWALPMNAAAAKGGVIQSFRFGSFTAGRSRMVLDVKGPVVVKSAFMMEPRDERRFRYVVDLERAAPPRPAQSTTPAVSPPARAQPAPQAQVRPPVQMPQQSAAVQPLPKPAPRQAPRPADGRRLVAIDAGHGGVDPGAIGRQGTHEKEITLAMARELKARMEATGRFRVVLTRDRDTFLPLRERVSLARANGAEMFISLHADAHPNPATRGMSVYTLSEVASDREAEQLAAKENRADLIAGLDLSHESPEVTSILLDLAQRETMNYSATFAALLVAELGKSVTLLGKTHRFAGFAVLKAPDVPSVLIEMGYLSNSAEEKLLNQPDYRRKLAEGVIRAADRFFRERPQAAR
jgi:N-acetylmuramoyl-L-alanine amidase